MAFCQANQYASDSPLWVGDLSALYSAQARLPNPPRLHIFLDTSCAAATVDASRQDSCLEQTGTAPPLIAAGSANRLPATEFAASAAAHFESGFHGINSLLCTCGHPPDGSRPGTRGSGADPVRPFANSACQRNVRGSSCSSDDTQRRQAPETGLARKAGDCFGFSPSLSEWILVLAVGGRFRIASSASAYRRPDP
jgi:hypothetical protein